MNKGSNQQRIRDLYHMLFEMATGNLMFRLQQSVPADELDELAAILNSVATEMQSKIVTSGFINLHYSYQNLIQHTCILDNYFTIQGFSSNLPLALGLPSEQLFKKNFDEILAIQIHPLWKSISNQIVDDDSFHSTIQLLFITAENQIIPTFCTVSRVLYSNTIIISSITTHLQDSLSDHTNTINLGLPRPTEAAIIQNVYDYILNNLEDPLPSAKVLAKMFGTNEFRLKDGFRHFFNTSIYQFYTEERLKRAHLLIQQTAIPIKEIAFMCGFNDYTNFYKSFKKRFKYAPSEVKRTSVLE
ncbi:AraC family transcriptional regulator [Flavobacterium sp. 5]|uniref:AraC family transcriptional regulator n=1 Tax=Flavobacterium sp. 5 TaxID=2035199 RepID=UPI000C2BE4D9|nr:AraC family transcriptional regulator [Flavobacterium sp. 5]PKB18057.1 helix-turn-helix protein [Flavobacterium sp. 5]